MRFKRDPTKLLRFSGILSMLITTILFYESLYVAAGNPGFFVTIYFDYYGEGLIELIVFTALLPLIGYAIIKEVKDVMYWK